MKNMRYKNICDHLHLQFSFLFYMFLTFVYNFSTIFFNVRLILIFNNFTFNKRYINSQRINIFYS